MKQYVVKAASDIRGGRLAAFLFGLVLACGTLFPARALAQDSIGFEAIYMEAIRLQAIDRNTEAFELFRHAEALDPVSAEVKYALASFYLALENDSMGIHYLREAYRLAPDNYWYAEQLVETLFEQQQDVAAIEVAEEMRVRFPEREMPLAFLLEIYPVVGAPEKALRLLEQQEKQHGKSEEISMRKLSLWFAQGNSKKAFKELNDLIKTYPGEPNYRLLLANAYIENEKYKDARKVYATILADDARNEQAILGRVRCDLLMGDTLTFRNSINALLQNEDISDDTQHTILYMLTTDKTVFDTTFVCQKYDAAIAAGLSETMLLYRYVAYLQENQLMERAYSMYERLLHSDPTSVYIRRQLLGIAISQEDYPRVEELCLPATKQLPENATDLMFHYYLASAYSITDRYEEAFTTITRVLDSLPEAIDIAPFFLSDLYGFSADLSHKLGKDSVAFVYYDSALVHNPLNVGALNNYAYYLSLKEGSDLEKAKQMSQKTLEIEPQNSTYLDTYAWILFKLKRYEEARTYMDKCLRYSTEESAVLYDHAGDIYDALGLREEAINFWKKALDAEDEDMATLAPLIRSKISQ